MHRTTRRFTRSTFALAILSGTAVLWSCADNARRTGQIELYAIDVPARGIPDVQTGLPIRPALLNPNRKVEPRLTVDPDFGDPIRYPEDVVTIHVPSAYIDHLPRTWVASETRRRADVILFAEVWENAAEGFNTPSLNTVVHVATDQVVPGKLNFAQSLAYGPTGFKGYPLKIKFTLMILDHVKDSKLGDRVSTAASTVTSFMSAVSVAAPYTGLVSQSVSVVRDILRQQPNVVAFDFETTLFSDAPIEQRETILGTGGSPRGVGALAADAAKQVADTGDKTAPAVAAKKVFELTAIAADPKTLAPNQQRLVTTFDTSKGVDQSFVGIAKQENEPAWNAAVEFIKKQQKDKKSAKEIALALKTATGADAQFKPTFESLSKHLDVFTDNYGDARAWIQDNQNNPNVPKGPVAQQLVMTTDPTDAWVKIVGELYNESKTKGAAAKSEDQPAKTVTTSRTHLPDSRASAFNKLVAWFDYGFYALIETEDHNDPSDGRLSTRSLLPLDYLNDFEYWGGWLRRKARSIAPVEDVEWQSVNGQSKAAAAELARAFRAEREKREELNKLGLLVFRAEEHRASVRYRVPPRDGVAEAFRGKPWDLKGINDSIAKITQAIGEAKKLVPTSGKSGDIADLASKMFAQAESGLRAAQDSLTAASGGHQSAATETGRLLCDTTPSVIQLDETIGRCVASFDSLNKAESELDAAGQRFRNWLDGPPDSNHESTDLPEKLRPKMIECANVVAMAQRRLVQDRQRFDAMILDTATKLSDVAKHELSGVERELDTARVNRHFQQRRVRQLEDSLAEFGSTRTRSGSTVPDDRLQNNYIVFSIMPGQLEVDRATLAAASRANDDMMRKLQGTPGDAATIATTIKEAATVAGSIVVRQRLEVLALQAARAAEDLEKLDADKLIQEFDKRFDRAVEEFKNGKAESPPKPEAPRADTRPSTSAGTGVASAASNGFSAVAPDADFLAQIDSIRDGIKARWHGRLTSLADANIKVKTGNAR